MRKYGTSRLPAAMTGKFGYHENCPLLHHIPQGAMEDGLPVIVFPKDETKAVDGRTYHFESVMTRRATYTIETGGGRTTTYRVAHAVALVPTDGEEANFIDEIIYRQAGKDEKPKLEDALPATTLSGLAALKARLQAQQE